MIYVFFMCLALEFPLASEAATLSLQQRVRVTHDFFRVGVLDEENSSHKATLHMFRIISNKPLLVHRSQPTPGSPHSPNTSYKKWPLSNFDDASGIVRLICGDHILESHYGLEAQLPRQQSEVAKYLIPFTEAKAYIPTSIAVHLLGLSNKHQKYDDVKNKELLFFFISDTKTNKSTEEKYNEYNFVDAFDTSIDESSSSNQDTDIKYFSNDSVELWEDGPLVSSCKMHFLMPSEQSILQMAILSTEDGPVVGSVPIDEISNQNSLLQYPADSELFKREIQSTNMSHEIEQILISNVAKRAYSPDDWNCISAALPNTLPADMAFLEESNDEQGVEDFSFSESFLEMDLGSGIRGLMTGKEFTKDKTKQKNLIDLLMVILGPIVGPIGTMTADGLADYMKHGGAPYIDAAVSTELQSLSLATMTAAVSQRLTSSLSETIGDGVIEALSADMSQKVAIGLSARTTTKMTQQITEIVGKTLPSNVSDKSAMHLARLFMKKLPHLLSRSLSASVVPALAHTLTHNPLQDYYCYYCYKHKIYCQYCTYSPLQVYYAVQYTGYYSQYYGDYYADYFAQQLDTN